MTLTKMFGALFLTGSEPEDEWVMVRCVGCGATERFEPKEWPEGNRPCCQQCGDLVVPVDEEDL